MSSKCAVCNRGNSVRHGQVHNYATLLQSMNYINSDYAHEQCILKAQQRSLQFKGHIYAKAGS